MWTILPQLWNIWEKSEQFSARTSSLNRKSIRFSQFPLPVPCKRSSAVPIPFGVGFQFLGHAVSLRQLRHDQLHAVSCRFVNLSAILSYVHPAITLVLITAAASTCFCGSFLLRNTDLSGTCIARPKSAHVFFPQWIQLFSNSACTLIRTVQIRWNLSQNVNK